jgi:hypothetical protein
VNAVATRIASSGTTTPVTASLSHGTTKSGDPVVDQARLLPEQRLADSASSVVVRATRRPAVKVISWRSGLRTRRIPRGSSAARSTRSGSRAGPAGLDAAPALGHPIRERTRAGDGGDRVGRSHRLLGVALGRGQRAYEDVDHRRASDW